MASINPRSAPPQTSLADELSKLISDSRTQNAISSVRLADGTVVVLNPQRQQCDICKHFLDGGQSPSANKRSCHIICRQHKLFEPVSLNSYSSIKDQTEIARKALDHATDPAYSHHCCFVKDCKFPERIPSGWGNFEIMQHVIVSHTDACLGPKERQALLQGFKRLQK